MSFKGEIEARCPKGCEPFTTEVWSFIRGDQNPELRNAVLWRECNLLLCEECDAAFFPEASYVYFEPPIELLAFVFPESYREREKFWRLKMDEDFKAMRTAFGANMGEFQEPLLCFGHEELAVVLEREDFLQAECDVMEHYAKDLELSLYRVRPGYARREGVPRALPYAGKPGLLPTPKAVIGGLERVLAANDRLKTFCDYLARLKKDAEAGLPPPAVRLS